jgi:CheY-like chemotaxis protein
MSPENRTLDDSLAIQIIIQRLCLAGVKIVLAVRSQRAVFQILAQQPDRILVSIPTQDLAAWILPQEEKVALSFEDRGFKYESVITFKGVTDWESITCASFSAPRILRRADDNRLADFCPDTAPKVTFTNNRNALLDGQIKGLGTDGFEMVMQDSSQKVQEVLRLGEESTLDLALDDDFRVTTYAKVAYFGDNYVGMKFTDRVDRTVLGQYRNWLEGQQRLQAQRDRESFESGGERPRETHGPALPKLRLWVERDPAILILTEREGFARHMADALGRKFGLSSLDYIKGNLKPQLAGPEAAGPAWGRFRLIVIHNYLRLVSPLELCRQVVEKEHCPLPVLLAGTDETLELKRNRALAAGAVDYVPVEPFKILSVLRKLDETIKLFEGC